MRLHLTEKYAQNVGILSLSYLFSTQIEPDQQHCHYTVPHNNVL